MQTYTRNPEVQKCIDACKECHGTCIETVQHCLTMGGAHAQPQHLAVMLDCAETCHLSEDSMLRDSPVFKQICGLCADVCDICSTECERFPNDPQMKINAGRTRSCAQICRKIATAKL